MGKNMQNVPKLRFRGFDEDWQQNRLEELFVFLQNNTLSRAELKQESGIARNVHYGDVLIRYGEVTRVDELVPEYISNPDIAERFKLSLLSDGDIVFADTAEDETAGRCTEISETEGLKVISGLHTIPCHPLEKFAYGFIGFCLNASSFHNQLLPLMQGAKVTSISKTALASAIVRYPKEKDEQKLVGNTLMSVNNLITLHQRKLSKLQDLKNALLVKMFPAEGESVPAVRFKGYEGAWEQRSWKDCVDISTNMVDPTSCEFNDLPHIGPGNIESFTGQLMNNIHTAAEDGVISGKFLFQPGDIIYGKIRPNLGKYVLVDFKGLASADSYVLDAKNHLNQSFLYLVIQTGDFYQYTVTMSMRSGMPKVNREQLNEYYFNAPSTDEQKKIGNLIEKVRFLITLHQRKLSKLKDIKKALLNNMFPGGDI